MGSVEAAKFFGVLKTPTPAELQKVGILVFSIPDIFGRKSGHFQIIVTNSSIFGIKG